MVLRGLRYGVGVGVAVAVLVGDAVPVGVEVGGILVDVNVAVGACELWVVMRGLTQSAKYSWEGPFAKIVRMNLTFCPLNELRSISIG